MNDGPQRETWLDWCARSAPGTPGASPTEMLTRAELLATVERWGVKRVQESTLRYWQTVGVIPNPIIEGELGNQRALYPWWAADLIAMVRHQQDRGAKVEDLVGRMRAEAQGLSIKTSGRWLAERPAQPTGRPFTPGPLPADLEEIAGLKVVGPLNLVSLVLQEFYGVEVTGIDLQFHTATGDTIVYNVPVTARLVAEPADEREGDEGVQPKGGV